MGNFFFLSKKKEAKLHKNSNQPPTNPTTMNHPLKMHLLRNNFFPIKKKSYPGHWDILFNKYYYLFKKNRNVYPILVVCV